MKYLRPQMPITTITVFDSEDRIFQNTPCLSQAHLLLLYLDTLHKLSATKMHTSGYSLSVIPFYELLFFVHLTNLGYPSGKSTTKFQQQNMLLNLCITLVFWELTWNRSSEEGAIVKNHTNLKLNPGTSICSFKTLNKLVCTSIL